MLIASIPGRKGLKQNSPKPIGQVEIDLRHASSYSRHEVVHCSYVQETMVFVLIILIPSPSFCLVANKSLPPNG